MKEPPALHSAKSDRTAMAAISLIGLLFVLFLIVLGYATVSARDDAELRARDRAAAAAQVVAINGQWVVELAKQALRRIDESLGPDIADGAGQTVRDLREAVSDLPGTVKAYVIDADGDTLFSTEPASGRIEVRDRSYFRDLAAGDIWHISPLLVSRTSGDQIFVVGRRLERAGKFAGIAVLSFDARLFAEIWASLGLDSQSSVALLRSDGQLVVRYPLPSGPQDLAGHALFTNQLPKREAGAFFAAAGPDIEFDSYVGFHKVAGTDLIAVATVGSERALAAARRNSFAMLALGIPLGLGLAAASIWIARLLQRDAARRRELAEALETNRLLFRDTHHRVKNNLQSVQSLVRMQNIAPEAKGDLQRRIAAMTAVHEHIYRLDQYAEVNADEFIPSIVGALLQSFDDPANVDFDIDHVTVDRDHATPLALVVNEVVTNALKYAFPDGRKGHVSISLKADPQDRARLVIRDDGIGFAPDSIVEGMGSRLIRGMIRQLGGSHSYERADGTTFRAEIGLKVVQAEAADA